MKKHILFLITLTFFTLNAQENKHVELSDKLSITSVNENVYLVTHEFPWAGNSLVYKADSSNLVLIDTPYEPEATSLLLNYLKEKFADLKISAIVTGFHIDNLGGSKTLVENSIPIYGAYKTAELLKSSSYKTQEKMLEWLSSPENKKYYDVYAGIKFYEPTNFYKLEDGLKLSFSTDTLEVYFPGETHTLDNTVVYLSKEKILFGGCMILAGSRNNPGFIDDANMKEWPLSVKKLKGKFPDCKIVIPGHGSIGGQELLDHTIKVLEKNNNSQKN
ncbi:MAG: MBL fold metallo-hydrolase [Melioribacteraceae bacterium]|nr:MBL fold metallo-hydrolase [Melioribacteraceae bacterium]